MADHPRPIVQAAVAALILAGLWAVVLAGRAWARPPLQQAQEGQVLFQQKCSGCHTIGGGPLAGPDLQGVAALRPRDWLVRWIQAPDKMLAEGDPTATQLLQQWNNLAMPNLGLTQAQAEAIVAYLEATTAVTATATAAPPGTTPSPPAPSPTAVPIAGDPVRGRSLFTGAVHLLNGGPPCIACHSIAGLPALGGGTVGPDLTAAFQKYGGVAGLAAALANIAFPTMVPVYAAHPLSPQDQADLVSWLQSASVGPPQPVSSLPGLVAGGEAVLLLGLVQVIWRRRLHGVRRSLIDNK
jgi:mono/diheme cytochrome c family protein